LFVCETAALHSLVLSMGQSLLQNGLFQRGKVNGDRADDRIGCFSWFVSGAPGCLLISRHSRGMGYIAVFLLLPLWIGLIQL
ncbi:hypothetical protein, partial [Rhizobium sp. BK661]|uniref:hypothetical protein n=1 Tax=Rhizobium sp. BK661 TaxID=2586991 RepID=UPI0021671101